LKCGDEGASWTTRSFAAGSGDGKPETDEQQTRAFALTEAASRTAGAAHAVSASAKGRTDRPSDKTDGMGSVWFVDA